jgi:hypothetical protein
MRDKNGFYDSVATEMGIQREWITFGDVDLGYTCLANEGRPKEGVRVVGPPTRLQPCSKLYHRWKNAPISVNKGDVSSSLSKQASKIDWWFTFLSPAKIKVANPKTVIEAAMPNMTALADTLMVAYFDLALHINEAEGADIVSAASMPIFMLQQAIDIMQQIKDIGSKIVEENKKRLIALILSIVLMTIPFIGEAGGALFGGVAMIAAYRRAH